VLKVVRKRYGSEFYREIGEKCGGAVNERYGTESYSELAGAAQNTIPRLAGREANQGR